MTFISLCPRVSEGMSPPSVTSIELKTCYRLRSTSFSLLENLYV